MCTTQLILSFPSTNERGVIICIFCAGHITKHQRLAARMLSTKHVYIYIYICIPVQKLEILCVLRSYGIVHIYTAIADNVLLTLLSYWVIGGYLSAIDRR